MRRSSVSAIPTPEIVVKFVKHRSPEQPRKSGHLKKQKQRQKVRQDKIQDLFIYLLIYLFIYLLIYLFIYLFIYLADPSSQRKIATKYRIYLFIVEHMV